MHDAINKIMIYLHEKDNSSAEMSILSYHLITAFRSLSNCFCQPQALDKCSGAHQLRCKLRL